MVPWFDFHYPWLNLVLNLSLQHCLWVQVKDGKGILRFSLEFLSGYFLWTRDNRCYKISMVYRWTVFQVPSIPLKVISIGFGINIDSPYIDKPIPSIINKDILPHTMPAFGLWKYPTPRTTARRRWSVHLGNQNYRHWGFLAAFVGVSCERLAYLLRTL